jgi:hypothetical protein
MFIATIAVVAVIGAIFAFWLYQSHHGKHLAPEKPQPSKRESYKAVRINPHQHACPAAFERHHRIYLVAEAPLLPLMDCTKSEDCRCGYVHYDDRRQNDRRDIAVAMKSKKDEKERRDQEHYGRRKTDSAE